MLQALGLAQMLGQSGIYVRAARARLPLVPGLFASVLDREDAGQVEGRLGSSCCGSASSSRGRGRGRW